MNTIKQHRDQIAKTIKFLGKAKFTSAANLQSVAERNRRGFPAQLMKLGLILRRDLNASHTIFGLSKKGSDLAGVPKFDIHKVALSRVEHALIAQTVTLSNIVHLQIEDFEFEPQHFMHSTRPDAVWYRKGGEQLFIEIELSAKSIADGEMDRFFKKLISRKTVVVFREQALFLRYLKYAFRYLKEGIPKWEKVDGRWVKVGELIKVPAETWKHVFFQEEISVGFVSISDYFELHGD